MGAAAVEPMALVGTVDMGAHARRLQLPAGPAQPPKRRMGESCLLGCRGHSTPGRGLPSLPGNDHDRAHAAVLEGQTGASARATGARLLLHG